MEPEEQVVTGIIKDVDAVLRKGDRMMVSFALEEATGALSETAEVVEIRSLEDGTKEIVLQRLPEGVLWCPPKGEG